MNGIINTSGMVSGSKPTVGIASPTFPMSRFNLKNAPSFGHGVWNIKSAPKVYVVKDLCVDWRRQDMDGDDFNFNNIAYPAGNKSPFDGEASINPRTDSWKADEKPFRGVVCFFDPSSIEVELNPDVFPAGTPYKVTAVCGVHKGMTLGCIDRFREAQGMGNSQISTTGVSHNLDAHISDRPLTEAAFDGLYGFSDDQTNGFTTGTKFDVEDYNTYKVGAFGRGNGNYLIEPMGLTGGQWDTASLPAYGSGSGRHRDPQWQGVCVLPLLPAGVYADRSPPDARCLHQGPGSRQDTRHRRLWQSGGPYAEPLPVDCHHAHLRQFHSDDRW